MASLLLETGMKREQPDQPVPAPAPSTTRRKSETADALMEEAEEEDNEGLRNQKIAKWFWELVEQEGQEITNKLDLMSFDANLRDIVITACPNEAVLVRYLARLYEHIVRSLWVAAAAALGGSGYELVHLRVLTANGEILRSYRGLPPAAAQDGGIELTLDEKQQAEAHRDLERETRRYWLDVMGITNEWAGLVPYNHYAWVRKLILEGSLKNDVTVWTALLLGFLSGGTRRAEYWGAPEGLFTDPAVNRDARLFDYQFSEMREAACVSLVRELAPVATLMMKMPVPLYWREPARPRDNLNMFDAAALALERDQNELADLIMDVLQPTKPFKVGDEARYHQYGRVMSVACLKGNYEIAARILKAVGLTWSSLSMLRLGFHSEKLGYDSTDELYCHGDGSRVSLEPPILEQPDPAEAEEPDLNPQAIARRVVFSGGSKDFIEKLVRDLGPDQTVFSVFGADPLLLQPLIRNWVWGNLGVFMYNTLRLADIDRAKYARSSLIAATENSDSGVVLLLDQLFEWGFGGAEADDPPIDPMDLQVRQMLVNGIGARQEIHPFTTDVAAWVFGVLLPTSCPKDLLDWSGFFTLPDETGAGKRKLKLVPYVPDDVEFIAFTRTVNAVFKYGTHADLHQWLGRPVARQRTLEMLKMPNDVLHLLRKSVKNRNPGVYEVSLPLLFKHYSAMAVAMADEDYVELLSILHETGRYVTLDLLVLAMGGMAKFRPGSRVMERLSLRVRDWVVRYQDNHAPVF